MYNTTIHFNHICFLSANLPQIKDTDHVRAIRKSQFDCIFEIAVDALCNTQMKYEWRRDNGLERLLQYVFHTVCHPTLRILWQIIDAI